MFNYNGCICDVCKQAFTPESDVVVCPECGTPHHRSCYKELGHCVNEEKHSGGFEWNTLENSVSSGKVSDLCPACHTENPADAVFCENCGIALNQKTHSTQVPPAFSGETHRRNPEPFPPVTPKSLEGEFDGVSYKDMAIYIGPSAPYYIYHFRTLDRNLKHFKPFSWSACLFDGFYFLYRKMWLQALFVILVSCVFSAPSILLMLTEAGAVDAAIMNSITNLDMFITIGSVLTIIFKVFLGYWAIPQYRKKVAKDIKRIKARNLSNNDYYQTLVEKSGPVKTVLYVAVFLVVFYLFM